MSKPLTEYVRTHRGGCYDDFIKECERIDNHVLSLESQIGELKRSFNTIQLVSMALRRCNATQPIQDATMSEYAQFIVTNLKNEFHVPQYLHSYEAAVDYYNQRPHDEDLTDWVIICRPELKYLKRRFKPNDTRTN